MIRLTMQTGLLPAIIAMIDLFLYVFMTKTAAALAFNIILPKLYVNSLMSSLNTRKVWSFGSSSDPHNSNGPTLPQRRGDVISLSTVSRPQVFVTVESHHHREESLYAEKDETTTTSSDVYKGLDDKQQAESESSV
ncbi:hypothetical protein OF83DRAFT_484574 [Amylostereum chailletii]|nr:hypothetical protein OF83DRAFT_484574 [Amylostereum chailletii]